MQSKLLGVLCLAVLCTILTLGLWPFHSPKNNVTWLKQANSLSFGRYGTVQGSGLLSAEHGVRGSVEVWVQPDHWTSGTILAFYEPESGRLFDLQQSLSDLELEAKVQNDETQTTKAPFCVGDAFLPSLQRKKPIFVTITYGPDGTKAYLDGALAVVAPRFKIPQDAFTGRIVVGDSPQQPDSFQGQIRGLAIYDAELADAQVSRHYLTWTKNGHPDITESEHNHNIALYLFDEKGGTVIHNRAAAVADLYIPKTYTVANKIALEPFWKEFKRSPSYWKDNLMNVVGFIPVGFVFYAYFCVSRPIRRAMLVTIAVGAATSLTIEVLQAFLPTRDSGTTDLITNTLGTYVGVLCYRDVYRNVTKRFPWLSWFLGSSWFLAPQDEKITESLR
jgi:VanZ family protein